MLGGQEGYVLNAPDPLYRIDGAWYVCFDKGLAPEINGCHVLSFGINFDYSFDWEMNNKYGCHVHSFDPFVEAPFFRTIRITRKNAFLNPIIKINPKWKFYKYFYILVIVCYQNGLTIFIG